MDPFLYAGVEATASTAHTSVDGLISWQQDAISAFGRWRSGVAERVHGELIGAPILRASQWRESTRCHTRRR